MDSLDYKWGRLSIALHAGPGLGISGNQAAPLSERTYPQIPIVLTSDQVPPQTEQAIVFNGFYYSDSDGSNVMNHPHPRR